MAVLVSRDFVRMAVLVSRDFAPVLPRRLTPRSLRRHARAAVGTNALPLGASVEIELLVEVR
jgi:enamine deaminase RidA (YjgF/YER057c/UK114 family)